MYLVLSAVCLPGSTGLQEVTVTPRLGLKDMLVRREGDRARACGQWRSGQSELTHSPFLTSTGPGPRLQTARSTLVRAVIGFLRRLRRWTPPQWRSRALCGVGPPAPPALFMVIGLPATLSLMQHPWNQGGNPWGTTGAGFFFLLTLGTH